MMFMLVLLFGGIVDKACLILISINELLCCVSFIRYVAFLLLFVSFSCVIDIFCSCFYLLIGMSRYQAVRFIFFLAIYEKENLLLSQLAREKDDGGEFFKIKNIENPV